jgi:hypothetical protein
LFNWNRTVMTEGVETVDCNNGWVFDQSELVDTIRSDVSISKAKSPKESNYIQASFSPTVL